MALPPPRPAPLARRPLLDASVGSCHKEIPCIDADHDLAYSYAAGRNFAVQANNVDGLRRTILAVASPAALSR